MADYWKSNDRKYCDFCKCWIADNRPSIDFHEKGRRHQENVKKRLKNITKASAKAHKESVHVDLAIRQMEQAAMAAYRRDVESNSCADITSIAITKKIKEDNLEIKGNQGKVWREAKSKDGHTYYWNTLTNESVWEPPSDGFLSIEEQHQEEHDKVAIQLKQVEKYKKVEGLKLMQIQKAEEEEERARLQREKLKERRVTQSPEPVYGPIIDPGKNDAYGKWETVKETEYVDLQLPDQKDYFEPSVIYEPEEIKKEFKEKIVDSLDEIGPSTFKKRKLISGAKNNMRKRIDDN